MPIFVAQLISLVLAEEQESESNQIRVELDAVNLHKVYYKHKVVYRSVELQSSSCCLMSFTHSTMIHMHFGSKKDLA